ncbi:MAG: class I SAM-dependent methyltransferase [Candidatus Pacebacteria bacterium]|nr:class I SAM-dependent methyltransferase [Candidatus Paceibacterota bacterium]
MTASQSKSPSRYCVDSAIGYLISKYCPQKEARVLDVGCGEGDYCQYFISHKCQGRYFGIDILKSSSWQNRTENGLDISYAVYDAQNLENLARTFNFIISIQSLEHIEDDEKVMRGVHKCLEREGVFLLTIPSKASFFLYGPHGFRRYNIDRIRQLAQKSGFVVEKIIKVGGLSNFFLHFLTWTFPAIILRLKIWRLYDKYRFLNKLLFQAEKAAFTLDKHFKFLESGYAAILKKNDNNEKTIS